MEAPVTTLQLKRRKRLLDIACNKGVKKLKLDGRVSDKRIAPIEVSVQDDADLRKEVDALNLKASRQAILDAKQAVTDAISEIEGWTLENLAQQEENMCSLYTIAADSIEHCASMINKAHAHKEEATLSMRARQAIHQSAMISAALKPVWSRSSCYL